MMVAASFGNPYSSCAGFVGQHCKACPSTDRNQRLAVVAPWPTLTVFQPVLAWRQPTSRIANNLGVLHWPAGAPRACRKCSHKPKTQMRPRMKLLASSRTNPPYTSNVPVQARRRDSADVAWNRLLGRFMVLDLAIVTQAGSVVRVSRKAPSMHAFHWRYQ